jgi:hypothetical protein
MTALLTLYMAVITPAGDLGMRYRKELRKYHRAFAKPRDGVTKEGTMIYFARKQDCV